MRKDVEDFKAYSAAYEGLDAKAKAVLYVDKREVSLKDDDAFHIISGRTNSGKSNLGHHIHDLWTCGRPSMRRVSLDKQEFPTKSANALREVEIPLRVSHYDEANVSRRAAMGRFNKDLLTYYFSIRGKRGLHLWCNPSLEVLDRPFIEERVNGVWYVFKKPKGKYMFIPREGLLKMLDDGHNLKQKTFEKVGFKYALIKNGRFDKYPQNEFKEEYDKAKDERGDFMLDWLKMNHDGNAGKSENKAAETLGISQNTFRKYVSIMQEKGLLDKEKYRGLSGAFHFDGDTIKQIGEFIKEVKSAG